MPNERSRRFPRPGRMRWVGAVLLLAGCAASPPVGATAGPVVIPLDNFDAEGSSETVLAYYGNVFTQMRGALEGGTREGLAELRYLLAQHQREDTIEWARRQMEQFELLAEGLDFELGLDARSSVRRLGSGSAHEAQRFQFRFQPLPAEAGLTFGSSGDQPVTFRAVLDVRDFDVLGDHAHVETAIALPTRGEVRVTADRPLLIEFDVPPARAHVVVRELLVRIEILPCVLRVDGRRTPVGRLARPAMTADQVEALAPSTRLRRGANGFTPCKLHKEMLYPEGVASVQKSPFDTLCHALRGGDPRFFRHVFLASHFMPEKQREEAIRLLIDQLRLGQPDAARVTMGALRLLTRSDIAVTDRQAWLEWWDERVASDRSPR